MIKTSEFVSFAGYLLIILTAFILLWGQKYEIESQKLQLADYRKTIDSLNKYAQKELQSGGLLINGELFTLYDMEKAKRYNVWEQIEYRHQIWLLKQQYRTQLDSIINIQKRHSK